MEKAPDGFGQLCNWMYQLDLIEGGNPPQIQLGGLRKDGLKSAIEGRWKIAIDYLFEAEIESIIPSDFLQAVGEDPGLRWKVAKLSTHATVVAATKVGRDELTDAQAWEAFCRAMREYIDKAFEDVVEPQVFANALGVAEEWNKISRGAQKLLTHLGFQKLKREDRTLVIIVWDTNPEGEITDEKLPDVMRRLARKGIILSEAALRKRYSRALEALRRNVDFTVYIANRRRS